MSLRFILHHFFSKCWLFCQSFCSSFYESPCLKFYLNFWKPIRTVFELPVHVLVPITLNKVFEFHFHRYCLASYFCLLFFLKSVPGGLLMPLTKDLTIEILNRYYKTSSGISSKYTHLFSSHHPTNQCEEQKQFVPHLSTGHYLFNQIIHRPLLFRNPCFACMSIGKQQTKHKK